MATEEQIVKALAKNEHFGHIEYEPCDDGRGTVSIDLIDPRLRFDIKDFKPLARIVDIEGFRYRSHEGIYIDIRGKNGEDIEVQE